jgi:hypothetical protein
MVFPARIAILAGLGIVLGFTVEASAQRPAESFRELQVRLKSGDTIDVVDRSGVETRGRLAALSDVSLGLTVGGAHRDFPESAVTRIEQRRRDPIRNGLLIGAGTGAVAGFFLGRAADSPSCPQMGSDCGQGALLGFTAGLFWGGVAGWITDALKRTREVVYRPRSEPQSSTFGLSTPNEYQVPGAAVWTTATRATRPRAA